MRVRLDKNNEVTDCYSDMSDDNQVSAGRILLREFNLENTSNKGGFTDRSNNLLVTHRTFDSRFHNNTQEKHEAYARFDDDFIDIPKFEEVAHSQEQQK